MTQKPYVPPFRKRILKHPLVLTCISVLIAAFIRFVYYTSRKHIQMHPDAEKYARGEHPAIFAFWHGRMMLVPVLSPKNRKMNVLISSHNDGEIISRAMQRFSMGTVRGSSRKGGHAAALAAVNSIKEGNNLAITPDGPKGPFQKAHAGMVHIAMLTGAPIIPLSFSSSRKRHIRSWDKTLIALPFGTVHYIICEPVFIAETAEEEARMHAVDAIEKTLIRITDLADAMVKNG